MAYRHVLGQSQPQAEFLRAYLYCFTLFDKVFFALFPQILGDFSLLVTYHIEVCMAWETG